MRLDHRVHILKPNYTVDAYNAPVPTHAVSATIWAARKDASLGESLRAREVAASISAHFTVRHSSETAAIKPEDRLQLEGGLTYDIIGVRELERNRWLEIHAVARTD